MCTALCTGLNPQEAHILKGLVERYLMSLTYAAVFECILMSCEEEDIVVHQRIRAHSCVTAKHLDLDIDEENPSVRSAMNLAIVGGSC